MSVVVGLIDYGAAGNLESVRRALVEAGAEVSVLTDGDSFSSVDKLVLPGVGGFHDVMNLVEQNNFVEPIINASAVQPILGICLGMQLLATIGFEYGETKGLDVISGEVRKIECHGSVPHIGFNTLSITQECPLYSGITNDDSFYFMHSYEFVNYTDILSLSTYCGHNFVSSIQRGGVYGVQFHPEKSRASGIRVLQNFIEL